MNYVEVEEASLKTFLKTALLNEAVQSSIKRLDLIIEDLGDVISEVPLVYMKLLYKAVRNAGAKPADVDVIKGVGPYGQFLAVTALGERIGEVRFIMSYDDGFTMNALLHLTPRAVELINSKAEIVKVRR